MLDPVRARAEADAAERRGEGTLWAAGPVAWEGASVGTVSQPEVVPVMEEEAREAPRVRRRVAVLSQAQVPRGTQKGPTAALAAILARLEIAPAASGGAPGWLTEAIGNPLTSDAAPAHRARSIAPGGQPGLAAVERGHAPLLTPLRYLAHRDWRRRRRAASPASACTRRA